MRRAKKHKNLSSARHDDQIGFRFRTAKTRTGHLGLPADGYNISTTAAAAAAKERPRGPKTAWVLTEAQFVAVSAGAPTQFETVISYEKYATDQSH